jgi:hypothetical protein
VDGPGWGSFVLEGLGGLLARQSFWARLCFLVSIGREHNRQGARSARAWCPLRARAKAWHGANRGLHPRIWESERFFLGDGLVRRPWTWVEFDCSRFLFRHGSGTDVCWCKAVLGGRDTSTIDGVWYCGVALGSHVERREGWAPVQCRAGTERRLGIHGRAGQGAVDCSTSAYIHPGSGSRARIFRQGRALSLFWRCVSSLIRDFARPGRSCSFFDRGVVILQT